MDHTQYSIKKDKMGVSVSISLIPESEGLPIAAVIAEYVTELCAKRDIAVFELGYNFLIMMKGIPPGSWVEQNSVLEEVTTTEMIDLLQSWCSKFPFIHIIEKHCIVDITYQQTVALDFQNPQFFDQLDAALEHAADHNDLSGFSL